MDQTATVAPPLTVPTGRRSMLPELACDAGNWRRAVEFARSHIAETLDADGGMKTVETRLAKWFDDFATTMKAPAVGLMVAGLDDAEMDRLLELSCKAARSSSGALVEQMLAAVYAKTASARPLVDVEFNRSVHEVINALDDIACTIAVLPRRQDGSPRS